MKNLVFTIVFIFCGSMLFAISPAPESEPKILISDALLKAELFAKSKINLESYYIDRVWVGRLPGEDVRKWIISWCPSNPETDDGSTLGWFIVVVDMRGNVSTPKHGVNWLDHRKVSEK